MVAGKPIASFATVAGVTLARRRKWTHDVCKTKAFDTLTDGN